MSLAKQRKNEEQEEEEGTNEGCRENAVIGNSKLIDLILIFDRQATVALRSSGIPNHQSFTAIDITFRYIDGYFRLCIS